MRDDTPDRSWIVAAGALALRLAAAGLLGTPEAARGATAWEWGAEQASLADALLRGDGLADPWGHGTGPSAWLTPAYPVLLAGLMKLFGGIGPATAWALFVVQSLADASICVALARIGRRTGVARAGGWAAVLWALSPLAIWNATKTVWDTTLVAASVAWFVERWLAVRARPSPGRVVGLGAAFGALLWLNPAPLGFVPVLGVAWLVDPSRAEGVGGGLGARLARAAAFFGCAALVCLPWAWRNARELGTWQLRSNLGVELRIGNRPRANGHPEPTKVHPSHVPAELASYRQLGEVAYAADSRRRAAEWIRSDPLGFVGLTLLRVELFWLGRPPPWDPRTSGGQGAARDPQSWLKWTVFGGTGLLALVSLARRRSSLPRRERVVFGALVILFGAPYYLTHVSERYRFPIEPLLVLLVAVLLTDLVRRNSGAEPEAPRSIR